MAQHGSVAARAAPRNWAQALFAALMSCLMTFVVTCVVTLVNTGSGGNFVLRWMHAFIIAWPVACICILLFAEHVRRAAAAIGGR
jgi:hypothetical protein